MLHNTKSRLHLFRGYLRSVNHKALILEAARTVYIPIPKAANSSITLALYPTLDRSAPTVEEMRIDKTLFYTSVKNALKLADQDWFVFSVVRHPIDRSRSAYRDKVVNRIPIFPPCKTMGIQPEDSYEAFVRKCRKWPPGYLNDHFQPQSNLLKHALKDDRFRFFKFENLAIDWIVICDQIEERCGVRPSALPHTNASKRIPSKVSAQALDLACKFYRKDFRSFAYNAGR